jgi:hypothetical protein
MLKSHPDRVCTICAVDFEPIVGFCRRLPEAVEAAQARLKAAHWASSTVAYVLRDTVRRRILVLDFRRCQFQTLGLEGWQKDLDENAAIIRVTLETLGVARLKRVGFQAQAFLPLGMSQREMADLMFGSYLLPAVELQDVCGKLEDVLVQLHGEREGMKLQLILAPMTADQAVQQFQLTPNLETFLEPKLFDMGLKEFKDRIAQDCFFVSADLSRADVPTTEVSLFSRTSLEAADTITGAAVQKLKSLRVKKGR